jgi:hypothetical protein
VTGRTLAGTAYTLAYDYDGQLTSITQGSAVTSFAYDAAVALGPVPPPGWPRGRRPRPVPGSARSSPLAAVAPRPQVMSQRTHAGAVEQLLVDLRVRLTGGSDQEHPVDDHVVVYGRERRGE